MFLKSMLRLAELPSLTLSLSMSAHRRRKRLPPPHYHRSARLSGFLVLILALAPFLPAEASTTVYSTQVIADGPYNSDGTRGSGDGCYVAPVFGASPTEVAIRAVAAHNAITGLSCAKTCRNPAQLVSVSTSGTSFVVASQCNTANKYTFLITAVSNPKQSGPCAGNPCRVADGVKIQTETDYTSPTVTGLSFTRMFNSHKSMALSAVGSRWTHNYDRRLTRINDNFAASAQTLGFMQAWRPDARVLNFTYDSATSTWRAEADISDRLIQDVLPDGTFSGWRYEVDADNSVERYNTAGKLLSLTDAAGRITTLAYDSAGHLSTVTGPFGHKLTFTSNSAGYIDSVTDPNNQTYHYTFDTSMRMTRVSYPDGSARIYHYENTLNWIDYLTGISDVDTNGVTTRYATYTYNSSNGSVISTEHAGGQEKVTLTFDSASQTTVTDASNTQVAYQFGENLGIKTLGAKVNQIDGKSVVYGNDPNNNLTCQQDEEGHVTTSIYNTTNQRVSQTTGQTNTCASPVTTTATRTTTYQYLSPNLDLPTVIESPSVAGGGQQEAHHHWLHGHPLPRLTHEHHPIRLHPNRGGRLPQRRPDVHPYEPSRNDQWSPPPQRPRHERGGRPHHVNLLRLHHR